jgi:2-polyprenyl-3-methyl-5-hydroxy-6-metoxy-1,4-benzoquinol methylase
MDDIKTYYEKAEANSYRMSQWGSTSRIAFLKDFITQYTPKGGKVLDVGCGDMFLASVLPDFNWTGIDINPGLSISKLAICHDLSDMPYPGDSNSFDTIICSEVLEHLFDPVGPTKEIHRLLKPGGTYIVSTPNLNWIDNYIEHFQRLEPDLNEPWTYEHIHYYSLFSHQQILHTAGFLKPPLRVVGCDAQFSPFFCQGREALRKALNIEDPSFTKTDQVMGEMFAQHSHTIMLVVQK